VPFPASPYSVRHSISYATIAATWRGLAQNAGQVMVGWEVFYAPLLKTAQVPATGPADAVLVPGAVPLWAVAGVLVGDRDSAAGVLPLKKRECCR
jgi:hypothetical protein